jgi:hypothetical protein
MMTTMTLYEVAGDYRRMVEALMDAQENAQAIEDTIAAESYPLEIKAQNVAYAIRNLEASAAAIKEAEAQMAARRKAIENRAAHIREYLKTCLEIANVSKVECPHFAIAIQNNPPSVDIFEPGLIPAEFMTQPEPPPAAPNKTAIAQAIKAGREIPGAKLVQGKRMVIR